MKIVIVEDEQPAVKRLERLLKEINPDAEILISLSSVELASNWLNQHSHPDIIFMDIQLDDGICFEIFEKVQINTPVIFTTAFDNYAIEAFKVNSVDYLLKPVNKDDLERAIEKYRTFHRQDIKNQLENLVQTLKPKVKERFLVKVGEHYRSVQATDIAFFYISQRCNFFTTRKGKTYPIEHSLERIEQLIDKNRFFRVNRNFIVNFDAISDIISYSSNRLKLIVDKYNDEEDILVSRDRVGEFKRWMDR